MHIRLDTELLRAEGTRRLEAIHVRNTATGVTGRLTGAAMFVLIGAGPHTAWLEKALQRDPQGHILTGRHVVRGDAGSPEWPEEREPFMLVADGAIAVRSVREFFGGE